MNILLATYVDNHAVIQYPIKFLCSEFPALKVFVSDEAEQEVVGNDIGKERVTGIVNVKIREPSDIATAQNTCLKILFDQGADYVMWLQADIYPTPLVFELMEKYCTAEHLTSAYGFHVRHIRLFQLSYASHFGCTIVGKLCPVGYTGDGAYIGGGAQLIDGEYLDTCIDIGYLTIQQYKNHCRQHSKTWNSSNHSYEWSDEAFFFDMLRHNRENVGIYGLVAEDSIYFPLFQKMGITDEYYRIKKLLELPPVPPPAPPAAEPAPPAIPETPTALIFATATPPPAPSSPPPMVANFRSRTPSPIPSSSPPPPTMTGQFQGLRTRKLATLTSPAAFPSLPKKRGSILGTTTTPIPTPSTGFSNKRRCGGNSRACIIG